MGPTNVALVKLFQADQALREAQAKLDATTKNVRLQERRLTDLNTRYKAAHDKLLSEQAKAGGLDLDIKSREEKIEQLRSQQSNANNNKEYQTFLVEINTQKVDKAKIEEDALKVMEDIEKTSAEVKDLATQIETESAKLATMKAEIGEKTAKLQAEIDELKGPREEAAAAVPPGALDMFNKLAERFDGEALAKIERPDKRREEYLCASCNTYLVIDVYNRLHTRDEMVFCTSCRRILYIPDDLPVEAAVIKRKPSKARVGHKGPQIGAYIGRQSSAEDILKSVEVEPDEPATAEPTPDHSPTPANEAPATESPATETPAPSTEEKQS